MERKEEDRSLGVALGEGGGGEGEEGAGAGVGAVAAIRRARYAAESGEQSAAGVQRDREGRVRNHTVVARSPVVAQSSPKRPLT